MYISRLVFNILLCIKIQNVHSKPNVIIFFADDMGYGDLQSFGHPVQEKGPIDVMAEEGMRFTHWYSADSMCSPSRAALLTGRLPIRSGVVGPERVFWQFGAGGLPKSESTIAEQLASQGYQTGIIGKWHLGINEFEANDGNHLPGHHGFKYQGTVLPYGQNWKCAPEVFPIEEMKEKCFKYKNGSLVQQPITLNHLTDNMVREGKSFITKAHIENEPFFLYFSLIQTHSYLFCSDKFCGKSKRGLYGDVINEMSWAVGQVLDTVRELNIEENTLAVFVSDHGPQLELCAHGGSAGLFSGGKASTWEGGIRVPAVAWWPGTIPSRAVSNTLLSTMDLFPTISKLAGTNLNQAGIVLDGKDIFENLKNATALSPHEILFHYCSDRIMAVRYGKYKIHFHTQNHVYNLSETCLHGVPLMDSLSYLSCYGDTVTTHDPPLVFDIESDPGEKYPLDSSQFSEIFDQVDMLIQDHKETIVQVPSQLGKNDPNLQPCCNLSDCVCNYDYPDTAGHSEL